MKQAVLFSLMIILFSCGDSGPTQPNEILNLSPVLGRVFVYEVYEYDEFNNKKPLGMYADTIIAVDTSVSGKNGLYATRSGAGPTFYLRDNMGDILVNPTDSLSSYTIPFTTLSEKIDSSQYGSVYAGYYTITEEIRKVAYLNNETFIIGSESLECKKFSVKVISRFYGVIDSKKGLISESLGDFSYVFSPKLCIPVKLYRLPYFDSVKNEHVLGRVAELSSYK
jgi:hypothetical protein